ncbi:MAG: pentapeptide repeat-containing protein [Gemmatimonadota bacterium]|nr:pentapeptide repeat-containing protein [Gemmatimonadota bacterium]
MKPQYHATIVLIVSILISVAIVVTLITVDHSAHKWFPEVVVTLTGLIGASWFIARRLYLLDKGINQRDEADAAQLAATERGALSGAVKEAVTMMSDAKLTTVLAGQRWLHQIAGVGREEAELVRALLCSYLVGHTYSFPVDDGDGRLDPALSAVARQAALVLMFGDPGRDHYESCADRADLAGTNWQGMDLSNLDVSSVVFRKCRFTGATISGTKFDKSDLRETYWAGDFGGNDPTSMEDANMCGIEASSCVFRGVSFRGANMSNNGRRSRFRHCRFVGCDFRNAKWTGAEFMSPEFEECTGITYDLCRDASLDKPKGLPAEVVSELNRMRPAGYQPSGSEDAREGADGVESD